MIPRRGWGLATALAAFFCCGTGLEVSAQQQERKLLERIQRPDMTLGSPLQNKPFSSAGRFGSKDASFASKSFSTGSALLGRDTLSTRSFFGIRNPWFGRREFATKPFTTEKSGSFSSRNFSVRSFAAEPYRPAGRGSEWSGKSLPVKAHVPAPAAPGAVQQLSERISKDLTIDEVRELLNKPR
jgi:hypothetical protein